MAGTQTFSLDEVREVVALALRPGHFFVAGSASLTFEHVPSEDIFWEMFQGRLLDGSQTRERRSFEAWQVFWIDAGSRSTEPILSVKLDTSGQLVHVTRAILSYAWEGYHAGNNVYLSRETRKWARELVVTLDLGQFACRESFEQALAGGLFQAVIGTSRLPLTSVEAPLPAFTLGQLAYFHSPDAGHLPMRSPRELLERALVQDRLWLEKAKVLETLLRATPSDELPEVTDLFGVRWQAIGRQTAEVPALLRTVFDEVALSPYTDFVDQTLQFLKLLEGQGRLSTAEHVDFLSGLLRELGRHLTAYDLVKFHHRGANYPDALLLDAALKAYLELAERRSDLIARTPDDPESLAKRKRIRRRALRQACLIRSRYEGHPVPDAPTSPGENARVLPPPHVRIPEAQILDPEKRTRRLSEGDPLLPRLTSTGRDLLRQSIEDLEHPFELRELGMALFLDRPLAGGKVPGGPTILLSYEAFSRSVAEQRLEELRQLLGPIHPREYANLQDRLRSGTEGVPLVPSLERGPIGVVSLSDPFQVAPDFALVRTTRRSVDDFLSLDGMAPLVARFLGSSLPRLIVSGAFIHGGQPGTLLIYDDTLTPRLELAIEPSGALRLANKQP